MLTSDLQLRGALLVTTHIGLSVVPVVRSQSCGHRSRVLRLSDFVRDGFSQLVFCPKASRSTVLLLRGVVAGRFVLVCPSRTSSESGVVQYRLFRRLALLPLRGG